MKDQILNYEDYKEDLESFDFGAYEENGLALKTIGNARLNMADALEKICAIYSKVRPVLKGIAMIPFIPKQVKIAVNALCKALDLLCPNH